MKVGEEKRPPLVIFEPTITFNLLIKKLLFHTVAIKILGNSGILKEWSGTYCTKGHAVSVKV